MLLYIILAVVALLTPNLAAGEHYIHEYRSLADMDWYYHVFHYQNPKSEVGISCYLYVVVHVITIKFGAPKYLAQTFLYNGTESFSLGSC